MINRYKIYQVIPYYPPSLGGMQNCARIIAEYFAKKNYKVEVLTSNQGVSNKYEGGESANLTVKYLNSFKFANTPISIKLVIELMNISRESVVHVHIANAFFPELVYLISKIKKYKYIAHYHIDVQSSGFFGVLLPIYKYLLLKPTLRNAEKIICLTDSFKKNIAAKYKIDLKKIIVIPNGVDNKYFMRRKIKSQPPYNLLFIGRLSHQKNLYPLLRAMGKIKANANLYLIGDGDQKKIIENIIINEKINNIHLLGRKEGISLIKYYSSSDLFILPSKNEGMSLALLEAMAAGMPIIAFDIPQTREFVGRGALLINKDDPQIIASAIDNLLNDYKRRQEMSIYNSKEAQKFKWEKVLNNMEQIYNKIY